MPVPDYQSLMLPTLKALSDGVETSISELRARIATAGGLTKEDVSEKLPSGRQTVFANRVGWALLGLDRAGLVQRVRRAVYFSSCAIVSPLRRRRSTWSICRRAWAIRDWIMLDGATPACSSSSRLSSARSTKRQQRSI